VAIPIGAYHWAREGLEELIEEREVGIEILMLAATAGAGALGLWDEAAALVFLYGTAEGVEEYTYARTRHAIRSLLDLDPKQVRLAPRPSPGPPAPARGSSCQELRGGSATPPLGWISMG
jgi:Cd2+/Zn2+-exporting ATPase